MKRLVEINLIPHSEQRYPTWADWEIEGAGEPLKISISKVGNWRYEYIAALHEFLEIALCMHMGISQKDVDDFDVDYESRRMAGEKFAACGCEITDDPGSDEHAPYRIAHIYATSVEYGFQRLLGVAEKDYDEAFIALDGGVAGNRK